MSSQSELQTLCASDYFTSQTFMAYVQFTTKVYGLVEGPGKLHGTVVGNCKNFGNGNGVT